MKLSLLPRGGSIPVLHPEETPFPVFLFKWSIIRELELDARQELVDVGAEKGDARHLLLVRGQRAVVEQEAAHQVGQVPGVLLLAHLTVTAAPLRRRLLAASFLGNYFIFWLNKIIKFKTKLNYLNNFYFNLIIFYFSPNFERRLSLLVMERGEQLLGNAVDGVELKQRPLLRGQHNAGRLGVAAADDRLHLNPRHLTLIFY